MAALLIAAAGLWFTGGVLDIVGAANGVARVALLPAWWWLATLVVIFGGLALVAARRGLNPDLALPLCALGLLAVPYLPWLADRLPVLRAPAGPVRNLLWLVVFWPIALRAFDRVQLRVRASVAPLAVFVASAAIFGTAAWRLTDTPYFPGGDEPHYLVIVQSLLQDRDLRIEDNHQREEYRAYFNRPLRPDYLSRGVDGEIYSVHPVGLPVLALPAFALGGYHGVVLLLVMIAALAAVMLWQWTYAITGSASAASFGWAAAALTGPYLFNSFTVYPEIPGALAVMVAVAWRWPSQTTPLMVLRGLAIGALPWLSTKYAPMAAAITIVLLLRVRWNLRAMAALLAPIAVAFAGWFAFFYWIWGTVSPSAPYGATEPMTLAHLARGAPGLLFDQEYGIVAYAPILALAFPGLALMLRGGGADARRALEVMFIFAALLGTAGAFHLWWGGTASPGRPLASGVLLLGVPIASLFASTAWRTSARAGLHVLLAASLAIACALAVAQDGGLLNNDRDGSATFLAWASPTWPVSSAFPAFVAGSWAGASARALAWLALLAAIAWGVQRIRPRGLGAAAAATMGLAFIGGAALISIANTTTALPTEFRPEALARVPLLDGFDARRRPTTILYDPLSRIASADALSHVALIARPGLRTAPQPADVLWNARFALPAGEYRVQLARPEVASRADTTLAVQIGRVGRPVAQWEVSGSAWEHRLVLPIDAIFVGFRAPPELVASDSQLQITPVRVVDESRRVQRPPILGARKYGAVTAWFHDDLAAGEPAGYWTRGGGTTRVTYSADMTSPATVAIVVHCGPIANRVTFRAPGWEETMVLKGGETRALAIPTIVQPDLGVRLAAVDISARDGFRPADVEPSSKDQRFLGCRIEPATAP